MLLENSIDALAERKLERMMSYAHVATLYVRKLIFPFNLSYDWGWPCVKHITTLTDFRNLGTLLEVMSILCICWYSLKNRNAVLLWSLALTIIRYVPASNLFFPVGTIVAERLLFLPSMGFCLGAGYSVAELINAANAPRARRNAQFAKRAKLASSMFICAYILFMGIKT